MEQRLERIKAIEAGPLSAISGHSMRWNGFTLNDRKLIGKPSFVTTPSGSSSAFPVTCEYKSPVCAHRASDQNCRLLGRRQNTGGSG